EQSRATAANLEEYLAGLQMRASCVPVGDANIERVTQLTNKTNQFNVTTRRRTIAEVRHLAGAGWTGVFSLQDRYGDDGILGVIFALPSREPGCWTIDTWLMSCRVLRRDVEKFMLDCLVDGARAAGVDRLVGEYVRTEKNALVADLFVSLGFEIVSDGDERRMYRLDLERDRGPLSRTIARERSDLSFVR